MSLESLLNRGNETLQVDLKNFNESQLIKYTHNLLSDIVDNKQTTDLSQSLRSLGLVMRALRRMGTKNAVVMYTSLVPIAEALQSSGPNSSASKLTFIPKPKPVNLGRDNVLTEISMPMIDITGLKPYFVDHIQHQYLEPVVKGLPMVSNFMLLYGTAGCGQNTLAVYTAQWLKREVGGVKIFHLNARLKQPNLIWGAFNIAEDYSKNLKATTRKSFQVGVRVVLIVEDIDLMSQKQIKELSQIRQDDFPHVLLIATTTRPMDLDRAVTAKFFPVVGLNLPAYCSIIEILNEHVNKQLKSPDDGYVLSGQYNEFSAKFDKWIKSMVRNKMSMKFKNEDQAAEKISGMINNPSFSQDVKNLNEINAKTVEGYLKGFEFSPNASYIFGYNYDDIVNLSRLIVNKFTIELNKISGSSGYCVYDTSSSDTIISDIRKQKTIPNLTELLKNENSGDNKPTYTIEELELLEDLLDTTNLATLSKVFDAIDSIDKKADFAKNKTSIITKINGIDTNDVQEEDLKKDVDDMKAKIESATDIKQLEYALRDFLFMRQYRVQTDTLVRAGYNKDLSSERLRTQCSNPQGTVPKATWKRLSDQKSHLLEAWVLDVFKSYKSTVGEKDYLDMLKYFIETSPAQDSSGVEAEQNNNS